MPEEDEDWRKKENEEEGDLDPPDRLRDKWFREELSFRETVSCPLCHREVPRETLSCMFCGAQVFEKSGLLGTLLAFFKRLFRG